MDPRDRLDVPIAIVSVVDTDRIWFKSHHGLEVNEIGRDPGLCASAILGFEPWVPHSRMPTKDEMADYLESYAETFVLPVRTGVHVSRLSKSADRLVHTDAGEFTASNVIVASGSYGNPRVPPRIRRPA